MISLHLLSIPLGRFYAAAVEWTVHRYLFHGYGKKKGSPFSFHYHDHHRACRKFDMKDPSYTDGGLFTWNGHSREFWGIIAGMILHMPLILVAPGFLLGTYYGAIMYMLIHHRAHQDIEWCKTHARWHYDHHMAPNQDVNWGVTNEWFDKLMGTRQHWAGPKRKNKRVPRPAK